MRNPTIAFVAVAWASGIAFADEPAGVSYTSFTAIVGKPLQVAVYAAVHKDCTAGPAPMFRIIVSPQQGVLTVRRDEITTDADAPCPHLKAPAVVVIYQTRHGAAGSDRVAYEIDISGGKTEAYDVAINIKPASAPASVESEKPI